MRSHDISDFPDPVTGRGNGVGFSLQGGPNSDLSSTNPAFERAVESCQHILGHQFHSPSDQMAWAKARDLSNSARSCSAVPYGRALDGVRYGDRRRLARR